MKIFYKLSIALSIILGLCSICTISEGANWKKYFTNAANYEFYYDEESITYLPEGTIMVWEKIVPHRTAEVQAWKEWLQLKEVDCSRRKVRRLQGLVTHADGSVETLGALDWVYLEPTQLDECFYKTICQKRDFGKPK